MLKSITLLFISSLAFTGCSDDSGSRYFRPIDPSKKGKPQGPQPAKMTEKIKTVDDELTINTTGTPAESMTFGLDSKLEADESLILNLKFNSKTHTKFADISTFTSGCGFGIVETKLLKVVDDQLETTEDKSTLIPESNYVYQVSIGRSETKCSEFEFVLTAWAGVAQEVPVKGFSCTYTNEKASTTDILNSFTSSAYLGEIPSPFLGYGVACGKAFEYIKGKKIVVTDNSLNSQQTSKSGQKYSFSLAFDPATKNGNLSCSLNNKLTQFGKLENCNSVVFDKNQFEEFQ